MTYNSYWINLRTMFHPLRPLMCNWARFFLSGLLNTCTWGGHSVLLPFRFQEELQAIITISRSWSLTKKQVSLPRTLNNDNFAPSHGFCGCKSHEVKLCRWCSSLNERPRLIRRPPRSRRDLCPWRSTSRRPTASAACGSPPKNEPNERCVQMTEQKHRFAEKKY